MRLPLIALCLAAGSAWSSALADQTAAVNPKTTAKQFVPQASASGRHGKPIYTSKTAPPTYSNQLSAAQQLKLDPKAQAAQKLAQMKRAAQAQSAFAPLSQGMQAGAPQLQPSQSALNGSDDCSTADPIAGAGVFTFDTTTATTGPQQSLTCGLGSAFNDVWFDWTCPTTGVANWTLCGGAGYDTLVAVYGGAGCPTPGTAIVCDDDSGCGLESTVQFACTAGSHYMLQLGAFSNGSGAGTFSLSVSIPSANDNCSTPVVISGAGPFNFDNTVASTGTDGQSESLCAVQYGSTTVDNDVWFSWTAPSSGVAQVSTCGLTSTDTKIAAYAGSGCPAAGSALACRDDSCFSFQTTILFPVTAGSTYTIQVGTFPGASGGTGAFTINVLTPPSNDDCTTPVVLGGSGTFPFDTTVASTGTFGQSEALCAAQYGQFTIDNDVWYSWTAPSTGVALVDTCGLTNVDTKIAVYGGTACPTPGSALACLDDACAFGLQTTLMLPVTAGSTYLIQLGNFPGADGGPGSLSLSVVQPPPNDDCTAATPVAGLGSFPFNNLVASTGAVGQSESLCNIFGTTTIDHDVWYSWVAPTSGCTVIDTCGSTVDTKMAVYHGAGCPAAGTAIACSDDSSCGQQSSVRFTATAGQTYVIQLGTFPGGMGGSGTFNITQQPAGAGNDECSGATVIAGLGVFPFDNSPGVATTGCEGQSESLCAIYGLPEVPNDVWFTWTAPTTGFAVLDTCGLTSVDTKVGIYSGAGCPAPGSAIACVDDSCPGFETTVVWNCTAGSTYTIQMGTFPFATGGTGSFSLNVILPPTNDDCTAPVALGPTGPYAFALIGASTGTDGQSESLCNFYGMTAVENDIWYTWTAPSTGRANLTLCSGSSFDSKIAVYPGAGCPAAGTALACNDDACGLTSEICFDVTGGATYTIQIGTFPGAGNNFTGSFDILLGPALPPCTWDDGTTENLLTWGLGGDMVWLNRFGTSGSTTLVSSIDVMYGSAMFAGYNPASSGFFASDVYIWQDGPSQDGDPSDATLLLSVPTTVSVWDTDTYVTIPITPLSINGVFFVGSHQDNYGLSGAGPAQFVAPMDQNCPTAGVAWFFGNNSGFGTSPVDVTNPANNIQPPFTFDSIGLPCQVCIRAGCNSGPASYICDPGSGPTIGCPCSNPATGANRGCNNSSATGGASITGSGSNSLSSPTLAFTTAGEKPTATSIVLQGTVGNTTGLVFGQGVRCAAGTLKRLYVKTASGGSILAPNLGGGDANIPTRSAAVGDPISAGQSRWYMVYYRDPIVLGGCSAFATFNGTNTAQVLWQP